MTAKPRHWHATASGQRDRVAGGSECRLRLGGRPARGPGRLGCLAALALAAGLALAPSAYAAGQPGTLDRTFGGDGRVETRVPGGAPAAAGVAVTRAGRILVAGTVGADRAVLLRFRPDGRPDARFEESGVTTLPFPQRVVLEDMELAEEGAVLLAGSLGGDAVVMRVQADGGLDSAFGDRGVVTLPFSGSHQERVTGVALQPGGDMILAVDIDHAQRNNGSWNDVGVARVDATGALDSTFGDGGLVHVAGDGSSALRPVDVAVDASGRVVIAVVSVYTPKLAAVSGALRLLPDGSPDPAFGPYSGMFSGIGLLSSPDEVAVGGLALAPDADHPILAGQAFGELDGRTRLVVGALRPNTDASMPAGNDPTFARGGVVLPPIAAEASLARAVAIDAQGSIVAAGGAYDNDFHRARFAVARIHPSGRPDPGFALRGATTISFPNGRSAAAALALQPDGRILVAGPAVPLHRKPRSPSFQIARLHGGYDRRPPRLVLGGLPREGCGQPPLRVVIRARDQSPLRRLTVRIDGRVRSTAKKRVVVRLRRARPGRHRIAISAIDVAGNAMTARRVLMVCG